MASAKLTAGSTSVVVETGQEVGDFLADLVKPNAVAKEEGGTHRASEPFGRARFGTVAQGPAKKINETGSSAAARRPSGIERPQLRGAWRSG